MLGSGLNNVVGLIEVRVRRKDPRFKFVKPSDAPLTLRQEHHPGDTYRIVSVTQEGKVAIHCKIGARLAGQILTVCIPTDLSDAVRAGGVFAWKCVHAVVNLQPHDGRGLHTARWASAAEQVGHPLGPLRLLA